MIGTILDWTLGAITGAKIGWKGATTLVDWLSNDSDPEEGSADDFKRLKKATEALYEDNQRLIELTQEHERALRTFRGWLFAAFLILLAQTGAILWLILKH